ncbi:hypothetical protein [uncultured Prochlorococcus sp.]|uniref:hypothetical protein n=1 Tax=uncultured Prochlorococcus sp. TaxID=159733 RepID=UPI00258B5DD4|nr:hypothetical protein [uncultured Prochlorococcus sp.]
MINRCPICNSSNTEISIKGYSSRRKAGFNYLRGVKSLERSNFNKIEEKIPLYFCLDCKSGWRGDTGLSSEIDRIYHTKHSLHWKSYKLFSDFLKGEIKNSHLISFSKLIIHLSNFLERKIDVIELGSPLMGVGFLNANPKLFKNISSITRNVDLIDSILLSQEKFTELLIRIYQFISHIKIRLKKLLKKDFENNYDKKIFEDLNKKINNVEFCDIPTSVGWGASSIICGQSTLKWLLTLNPKINLINKYTRKKNKSQLSICVNYIDHFDSPIKIIREMLFLSDFILFNIHKNNDAGIQHKYTFSDNFDNVINKRFNKDYFCFNISNKIINLGDQSKYNYFLVGKKKISLEFKSYLENIK